MPKLKLNCYDLFDHVQFVMKSKQENDVTDYIDVVYTKNKTELSWPIRLGTICSEN